MKSIEMENISFCYPNGQSIFNNSSLILEEGEQYAVIGKNGTGKSTLMKIIAGIEKLSHGSRKIFDQDYTHSEIYEIASTLAYVYQNPDDQIFNQTVLDEIAFGARNMGFTHSKQEQLIQTALHLCGLSEVKDLHPFDLSLSDRKIITIASALAMNPKILIFDEPTAGQDKKGLDIISKVLSYCKDSNITVLFISHDMEFVYHNFELGIIFYTTGQFKINTLENIYNDEELLKKASVDAPFIVELKKKYNINSCEKNIDRILDIIF